mgnify:CR=1 FL=1
MFARGNVCAVCRCLVVHQGAFVPHCHSPSLALPLSLSLSLSRSFLSRSLSTNDGAARALAHSLSPFLSFSLTLARIFRPFSFSSRPLSVALPEIDSLVCSFARTFVRSFVRSFVRFCSPPFFTRTLRSRLSSSPCTITVLCAPTRHDGQAEFNGSCLTFYDATTIRHVTRKSSRSSYSRVATTPVRFVGNFRVHAAALPRHLCHSPWKLGPRR